MQYLRNKDRLLRKWTAAQVMFVIERLPDCAGQATDAVSAYTQAKMEDAPQLLKIPKSQSVQIFAYVFHEIVVSGIEDPVVLQKRNLYGHPLAGGKKDRTGNAYLFIGNTDSSYRYTWMTQK